NVEAKWLWATAAIVLLPATAFVTEFSGGAPSFRRLGDAFAHTIERVIVDDACPRGIERNGARAAGVGVNPGANDFHSRAVGGRRHELLLYHPSDHSANQGRGEACATSFLQSRNQFPRRPSGIQGRRQSPVLQSDTPHASQRDDVAALFA